MKGLFCYDGPIGRDNAGNFYGTVLNNQAFERYFAIVDTLEVAIRVERDSAQNREQSLLSKKKLIVTEIPNLSSVRGISQRPQAAELLNDCIRRADLVFIRLPSLIGSMAVNLARKVHKPYLIELVGCPWDSFRYHSVKGKLIAPYMRSATKRYIRDAAYVVYVTKSFLQNRYPTKGKSIHCSNVELPDTEFDHLSNRLEHIYRCRKSIVLGTAAKVDVRYKGQQYVIEAISKLKQSGIRCQYQMAGWGDSTYLQDFAKKFGVADYIQFMGALPHDEIFPWLDSLDIYIQPSRLEGLPRALIEAMSRGCPAIGSAAGGIPELLDSDCIFGNDGNNTDELSELIRSFDTAKMLWQAGRNISVAADYRRAVLSRRRTLFFKEFADNAFHSNNA